MAQPKRTQQQHAQHAVYWAKVFGLLTPLPCRECGTTLNIEAHHPDYRQPLGVVWLCGACHTVEHKGVPDRDAMISAALYLHGEGLNLTQVALTLGLKRSTVYAWFRRAKRRADGTWHP